MVDGLPDAAGGRGYVVFAWVVGVYGEVGYSAGGYGGAYAAPG